MSARAASAVIEEVARRVVQAVHPERIILFSSSARREAGAESDLGLLIVKAGADPLEAARLAAPVRGAGLGGRRRGEPRGPRAARREPGAGPEDRTGRGKDPV
ncbi:MAG: hypothetical protein QN200_10685 [Armatimonadota bacterium]|nr:hypothetical protein [Armatimonadota bacterium]